MKWAKKLLLKWVADAQRDQFNEPHVVEESDVKLSCVTDDHEINMSKSIKFSVLPARGGCVLEIKSWDKNEGVLRYPYKKGPFNYVLVFDIFLHKPKGSDNFEIIRYSMLDKNFFKGEAK